LRRRAGDEVNSAGNTIFKLWIKPFSPTIKHS
jgi:hypothetical protein